MAKRRRGRLLAVGLAVLIAAAAAITAVLVTRPAEPRGPLTADGLFPVPAPRTVENVDLCGLLTDDEATALIGPDSTRWYQEPDLCTFGGVPGRGLDIINTGNMLGHTAPGYGPNTTIAGYPAILGVPDGYTSCTATVIVEPDPARPALRLSWLTNPDCESLRSAAELIIPRLPLAPS